MVAHPATWTAIVGGGVGLIAAWWGGADANAAIAYGTVLGGLAGLAIGAFLHDNEIMYRIGAVLLVAGALAGMFWLDNRYFHLFVDPDPETADASEGSYDEGAEATAASADVTESTVPVTDTSPSTLDASNATTNPPDSAPSATSTEPADEAVDPGEPYCIAEPDPAARVSLAMVGVLYPEDEQCAGFDHYTAHLAPSPDGVTSDPEVAAAQCDTSTYAVVAATPDGQTFVFCAEPLDAPDIPPTGALTPIWMLRP